MAECYIEEQGLFLVGFTQLHQTEVRLTLHSADKAYILEENVPDEYGYFQFGPLEIGTAYMLELIVGKNQWLWSIMDEHINPVYSLKKAVN